MLWEQYSMLPQVKGEGFSDKKKNIFNSNIEEQQRSNQHRYSQQTQGEHRRHDTDITTNKQGSQETNKPGCLLSIIRRYDDCLEQMTKTVILVHLRGLDQPLEHKYHERFLNDLVYLALLIINYQNSITSFRQVFSFTVLYKYTEIQVQTFFAENSNVCPYGLHVVFSPGKPKQSQCYWIGRTL